MNFVDVKLERGFSEKSGFFCRDCKWADFIEIAESENVKQSLWLENVECKIENLRYRFFLPFSGFQIVSTFSILLTIMILIS